MNKAVEAALSRLREETSTNPAAELRPALNTVSQRIDHLLDALPDGSAPREEILARLNQEKARKAEIAAQLDQVDRLEAVASAGTGRLQRDLRERVADVKALLGRHTPQARQKLRKLLNGKIEMEPVADGRRRGYRFRGALTIERLLTGEGFEELARSWWPQREAPVGLFPFCAFGSSRWRGVSQQIRSRGSRSTPLIRTRVRLRPAPARSACPSRGTWTSRW